MNKIVQKTIDEVREICRYGITTDGERHKQEALLDIAELLVIEKHIIEECKNE